MTRTVRFSPFLLAAMLSPAFLIVECDRTNANPNLASLEVEAAGLNRVVGFSSETAAYDVWTPAGVDMVTLRAQSAKPGARVRYSLFADPITSGSLGAGGGEITLTIPPGSSSIRIDVTDGGALRSYVVNINPPCSLGRCNDADPCTDDVCDTAISTCEFSTSPDGASCEFMGVGGGMCVVGICRLEWGAAELIETDDMGDATSPHVAVDPNGNATAVWAQSDGTWNNIWSNRYTAGIGWGVAELIETDDTGDATSPQVAVDPNGNVRAVWAQFDGTRISIWSNRYTMGLGWGSAELVETDDAGDATSPQVAVHANGNATAVWRHKDGPQFNIWSSQYTVGVGWGVVELLETDNMLPAFDPQVAVDRNGNATVVWRQFAGNRNSIWSNRYTAGVGWGVAGLLETDDAGHAFDPQVAVDPNGNATAVWYQLTGTRNNIWSNRYTAGIGWDTAQLIESDDIDHARDPQVSVDPNGNATVVWRQSDGTRDNIWSNEYAAGVGWGVAELIETDDTGDALNPQVAVHPNGNATAVWRQSDGTQDNIWSNWYTAGVGWGVAELLETDNAGHAFNPQVAVDPYGRATTVWHQSDGTRTNIWSNRFE
ncbi:MAG: hypothetical protein JRG67_14785 [Deltaproteobacteria bacterium]|nr:hypothetical protein [Deltaproteobacteria bacterium]MBW2212275.1 hypothetical protein [Deltaproteobacteria bacterium]MBW2380799.1 hypothetical protein [Deltaproteobacteria bacterium]MBW2551839.1 hypothetical protein [Deltaproteobacteria bacterium]MBW2629878.1 hypothetical protein [Deltaproteobacteria bacterium]